MKEYKSGSADYTVSGEYAESTIKKIISIDRLAEQKINEARKNRNQSELETDEQIKEMKRQFIGKSKNKIENLKLTRQSEFEEQSALIERQQEEIKEYLRDKFTSCREEWEDEILKEIC
ncbi:MAG: hypothetical protein FWG69_04355 [Oscillospiraceae bacterium]|nr:hypothetical protein [Oscillospiraceae bacterium]